MAAATAKSACDGGVLVMYTDFDVLNIQEFDILLTDIKGDMTRALEIDGAKHLSDTSSFATAHQSTLNGITFSDYSRVLVRAVLTVKERSINAMMLVDTGSPYTFLTHETFKALQVDLHDHQPGCQGYILVVNRQRTKVHLSKDHFENVSDLGTNFLDFCELYINYPKKTAQIKIAPV